MFIIKWHLVEFSPWPIFTGLLLFMLPLGFVVFIKTGHKTMIFMSIKILILLMFLWFRDIYRESTLMGMHNNYVMKGLKYGFILFIVSEILFFFSFFWTFFHSTLAPTINIGSCWPPMGIHPINFSSVPLLNTSVLLLSGLSVTWSHHTLEESKYKSHFLSLFLTIMLGVYFLYLQSMEYYDSTFTISDSVYGSTFFVMTGFHGLHVLVGTLFLMAILFRTIFLHFSTNHHLGFIFAAWYWHFVDVVWLYLFVMVYWWGSF